jgi:hypothetical protein
MHDPLNPLDPDPRRPAPPAGQSSGLPTEAPAGEEAGNEESYPWDADAPEEEDSVRQRHDAFTAKRKREFLRALAKTGCIADACRLTGVAKRTVYNHQGQDAEFLRYCALALRMCETPLELTAWQRAVEGVEEEYAVAGKVMRRTRYDASLLRLLLQASNPKKYGPRPGFSRKRVLKHERKQMEREIRAEVNSGLVASNEQVRASLLKALTIYRKRIAAAASDARAGQTPDGLDDSGGEAPPTIPCASDASRQL